MSFLAYAQVYLRAIALSPHKADGYVAFARLFTAMDDLPNAQKVCEIGMSFVKEHGTENIEQRKHDIAASFQAAVVDVLVRKTEWAIKKMNIRRVTLSGGVAANSELRKRMKEMGKEREVELFMPSVSLSTDNAAMIAASAYFRCKKTKDNKTWDANWKKLEADANFKLI